MNPYSVPWSPDEDALLISLGKEGKTLAQIATIIQRTHPAVKARRRYLRLTPEQRAEERRIRGPSRRRWTDAEASLAIQLVERKATDAECRAAVGRSFHCCYVKASRWSEQKVRRNFRKPRSEVQLKAPDHVWEDATLRATAPRSLTAILMGDPPRGFSALDRRT